MRSWIVVQPRLFGLISIPTRGSACRMIAAEMAMTTASKRAMAAMKDHEALGGTLLRRYR